MKPIRRLFPPRAGQCLALAAPASPPDPAKLAAGLAALGRLLPGLRLRVDRPALARQGHLAGEDQARARHLARLFADPRVGGVLAARGGFGASRLLPRLDLAGLAGSGKLLVGCSDLTCLLNALAMAGLVAVHGPVVTQLPRLDPASLADYAALISGRLPWPAGLTGQGAAPGRAAGPLVGGNLTMLCHLLGTPFFPDLAGAILFLEDTNEPPYRLDRLLTQLDLAGVLGLPAGFALGHFGEAGPADPARLAVVLTRLAPLNKPIVAGLPCGHGGENRCLPLGALAELDGLAGTLTVGIGLG